jgi:hypothetical protein
MRKNGPRVVGCQDVNFPPQVLVEPVLFHLGTDPSPLAQDDSLAKASTKFSMGFYDLYREAKWRNSFGFDR